MAYSVGENGALVRCAKNKAVLAPPDTSTIAYEQSTDRPKWRTCRPNSDLYIEGVDGFTRKDGSQIPFTRGKVGHYTPTFIQFDAELDGSMGRIGSEDGCYHVPKAPTLD